MRPIAVAAFTIDRTEVTVEAYRACIDAGACTAAATVGECNLGEPDRDRFAINCVTWGQARAYCAWAGGRLPTEAEWEAAARGTDGRRFPWGDSPPDDGGIHRADYGEGLVPELWARDRWTYDAPVGTFPAGAGPFGTLDMAGNLAEWVEDAYQGAAVPGARVVRGGSWRDYARRIRTSARDPHPAGQWYVTVGFRCVGLTSP
jgi:serine/threonine-protein kinase